MSSYLLDTNIVSFYLKGDESLKDKVADRIDSIALSMISYYEVLSGLQSINANRRIREFEDFCSLIEVVNIDKASILASCRIYASLKRSGNLIDDIDILIAGIALSRSLVMVTDNTGHFERISELNVENWKLR